MHEYTYLYRELAATNSASDIAYAIYIYRHTMYRIARERDDALSCAIILAYVIFASFSRVVVLEGFLEKKSIDLALARVRV